MIEIDGAQGEGGGQVLRSSLSLAVITRQAVRIHSIRARRKKPGLMRQHLTAVRAAATVGQAEIEGDTLGSSEVVIRPQGAVSGRYHFEIGTAGSTTMVLQTILWPLLLAEGTSEVVIEGGTHNPLAPPFDFVARALLPVLHRMGARIELELERWGFVPVGGGRIAVHIEGGRPLSPIEIGERGRIRSHKATAVVSNLDRKIAERELKVVRTRLGWSHAELEALTVASAGPGNVLLLEVEHDAGRTIISSIGERGRPAERVAARAVDELQEFIRSNVPVDVHLADQLLIPMALAGGGAFRTLAPSLHTRTNAAIVERFLPIEVRLEPDNDAWWVRVAPLGA